MSLEPAQSKLRYEHEHHDALQRMQRLSAYYGWTLDRLAQGIGQRILDAGCGTGSFTAWIAAHAEYVCAADLSAENLEHARARFADQPHVEVVQVDLDSDAALQALADRRFDTAVCLDVLEHVEDDVGLLRRLHGVIQPRGCLALKVPACPRLYGAIDRASDHHRRYTRRQLTERVTQAGWEVQRCGYMNIAGVIPYWFKSRVLRKRSTFSQTFSPRQLTWIGRVVPVLRVIDRVTGPFVGQSLVLVAQKDGRPRSEPDRGGES